MVLNCEDPTFLWGKRTICRSVITHKSGPTPWPWGDPVACPLPGEVGKHLTAPRVSRNSPPPAARETAKLSWVSRFLLLVRSETSTPLLLVPRCL